uniref:VWFA domain-containing protein n=1 Tax=Elaeophora elaphi TaxID=1147741 RepID=A0A0R3RT99_9BILA
MLGTLLFAVTCIYYKQSRSKRSHSSSDTKKQSTRNDKQPKLSESNDSNETAIRSNTKTSEKLIVSSSSPPLSLHDGIDDDDGDDNCYYAPGKKVFRMMDKPLKKKQQKSIDGVNIHIPKAFKPMLRVPKLIENRHRLSQTGSEVSSTSLLRKLLESGGERFHRTTQRTGSMLKKRFTNTVAIMEAKKTKLTNVESLNSSALTVPPEIGPVELGKDEMEFIDAEGDNPDCCRNRCTMKRGFRDGNDNMGVEPKRGFFQKFFRPTSSRSLNGGEGTSAESEGRPLLHDDDGYAVIDRRQDEFSSTRSSRDASLALDEATHDLLRLSSQPTVWYSSSSRPQHASDRISKSASTTSINKIIRTKNGEMMKLSNAFSWDTDRLTDLGPNDTSVYVDEEGRRHQTVTVYTNERRQGPPIVRTTVEGRLRMEKVVGADLMSVEHCTCSAWTIRDTVTHYKVKTTLGNRTLIMEESMNDENRERDFKMSLYEDGQLKTTDVADFRIPTNMDKAKYLSLLSQRLLHDMETLNQQEEQKTITRVEVEMIEDVTKILKTYIIGERNDLLQDFPIDQATVDATDEFSHSTYGREMLAPSHDFSEKEYIDVLEKEEVIKRPSPDLEFLFEGRHYEDHSEIRPRQRTDGSEATTTSESITQRYVPSCGICINVECTLKRMEDHSLNEVNVAVPNVFSAVLSLIRERITTQLPSLVSYGMEQYGKQYSGETTIRRLHRFESESFDEVQKTQKEPSFLFAKPQIIEPVKIPVLNITELDLRRLADTSAILANFAVPRTDQNQLDIERRYEFREAKGGNYGIQQKGQHFEGQMVLKKKRRFSLESESISEEEDICGPTYLNLTKQEARGEFEVAMIISNDQRSSPKYFQESQPIEVINLIAQISTDGKKEEIVATLATRISCKEVYMAQEMSTVISNAMITIQKAVRLDDIFQQHTRSWSDIKVERIAAKFSGTIEEQAEVFLNIASFKVACQEAYCTRAIPNLLRISYTGESFYSEDETVVIYMQNKLTTAVMLSCDSVRQVSRLSDKHILKTKATTEEATMIMMSIGHTGKYSSELMAESIVKDVLMQKMDLTLRASFESERVSNVSLNRGSKILAASARLSERVKQKEQMTITEFGDEREQVAILLQRAGIMHGQVQREWPEAVTGRSRTACITTCTTSTITITKTFNIFEILTDPFATITNTDFLSTDLTEINTTTKHFHLSNFKTILPARCTAQKIFPLINVSTVLMDLPTNYTQQISDDSEGNSVRITHELCNIDEIKKQINEEEDSLQMLIETAKNDDNEGQLEEMFDTFRVARDTYMHETSIVMKSQRSRIRPLNDLSDKAKGLALHTTVPCMQSDSELLFPSHESSKQTSANVDSTKKLPKTTDIPIIRTDETKAEGGNDTREIFSQRKHQIRKERIVPIKKISAKNSSNINSRKERFIDSREQWITELDNSVRYLGNNSLQSFGDTDSYRRTDHPFGSTEYINNNRIREEIFEESNFYLHNSSCNVNQWQKSMSPGNNIHEASSPRWNSADISREQQAEHGQRSERVNLQEFFCDAQQEQQQLHTFPRVKQKDMKRKLCNARSETRVAMLHAGFDLDTTLLATPEIEAEFTFAKDRSITTSEYFSDERSWSATTESNYKEREIHIEGISKSTGDLFDTLLDGNVEAFDEMSHISDSAYNHMKHSETERNHFMNNESSLYDAEKVNFQMTRCLTDSLESSALKEFHVVTEDEFSSVPETCKYNVTIRKSEQCEASSVAFSTGYHNLIQPEGTAKGASKALFVRQKEETDLKIDESTEKHHDFTSFWGATVRHVQAHIPSLGVKYQNEIFQQTTNSTKDTMETIDHTKVKPIHDKNVIAVDSETGKVQIYKQEARYNISKINYYQTVPQVLSSSLKIAAKVSVAEQEINQTDGMTTFDKATKSTKQASSETSPMSPDFVTTLQISAMTSGKTGEWISFEERNDQFDAALYFPPPKPMKKLSSETTAITEKAASSTEDGMSTVTKTSETKILQQQKETVKELKQLKQDTEAGFEAVERQMTTVSTFQDSEFLEEIKQLSRETQVLTEVEQQLRSYENEEVRKLTEAFTQQVHEKRQLIITDELVKSELSAQASMRESEGALSMHQQKSAEWEFEESAKTEIGDQFYQIERRDVNTKASSAIQEGRNLQTAMDSTVNILDLSHLEVEMEKAPIIEDVIIESKLINRHQIAISTDTAEQAKMIQNTDLRFISDGLVNIDQTIEVTNLEATCENFAAVKFFEEYREKACVRCLEAGHEEKTLAAGWRKVLRKASAEKVIPIKQTQSEKPSTTAIKEQNIEFSKMIKKMEPSNATEVKRSLKEVDTIDKQLIIASKTQEHSLVKKSSNEGYTILLPDVEITQTQAHIIEYGTVQITTTGSFAKLEQEKIAEKAEAQIPSSVKLESHFNTQFVAAESSSLEIQLECNSDAQMDEARSIVQKPIAKFTMNLKATREEVAGGMSAFKTQAEHISNVAHVLPDEICEAISSRIDEFGSERQQYIADWEMVQNALSADMCVAIAEFGDITCSVDAVKQENVQVIEQIEQPEFFEFTDTAISLKLHASEISDWEIVEGSAEAVFQQSNEAVAGEAITISTGYSEKLIGVFQEYAPTSTEAVAHFARILMKKTENYETKISNSISRHWEECVNLEACRECIANLEQLLINVEPSEMVQRTWWEMNHKRIVIGLIASSELHETCVIMFDKQSQCQSQEIALKNIDRQWIISEQYVVQNEVTKLLDTTWSTIVNDFDTAINIREPNHEQVTFKITASEEVYLESKNMLCMKPSHENASTHFRTITAVSGGERQFKIESKMNESILAREHEELFTESVQKAVLHAENVTESIAETSEAQSDAGILLMRRSAKRISEAASHIVGVVLTLSQQLKTQHAQETSREASVEFFIPASNLEIEDNIRQSAVNRDIVSLETKCAKATTLQETVELTKSRKVLAETESILKGVHTDAVREKLKEADSKGFEILSQWTTVDRDLEAEVRLLHTRNIVSKFSTVASSEEETSIAEMWVAEECNMETLTTRNVTASECCQRSFQIEFDEMRVRLENFEKEGNSEILWWDKNHDTLCVSMHESVLEKLCAVINLHRVSNVLPKQTANEYVWRDQPFLVAIPLYIKCEDMETDYTAVDICLVQEVAQEYLETVRISANWMESEVFECEEAGDERLHAVVELQGKRLVSLYVEVKWPEARKDDGIIVDVEEYTEDQATLYAQITSEQIASAEFNTTVVISQDCEPQVLITNATKEETVNGYDEFRIMPEEKTISYAMIIGNKGECLSIWLQETKQNFITVGFQYSEQTQAHEMEGNFVDKRFGGNYQLATKAAQVEDRNVTMAMLRRIENEAISEVLKENVCNFASLEVLASTSKVASIDLNWEKRPETASALTQHPCSCKAKPIKSRFLEIGEILHTVYAQFKIKEASWKIPVIWNVPNYGGHLTLNTESAEETILDREIEYHKNESFEIAIKTLHQVIRMTVPVLSAQHITEVTKEIGMDLVRQSTMGQAYLLLKQPNRGVSIEVKLIETTDIRQSSYLQLAREVESIEMEKIIKKARFGGKLNLTTSASEKCELNAIRELTSSIIRIAHCSQLIVSKNWNRGTYCEVNATESESADIHINLRNPESTNDVNWTACQKLLIRNTLTIQESEATMLTINLNYSKQKAKEISEKTVWLARNGEPCILTTSATTDEQKMIQWILEKRRDTFLSTSTRITVKNIAQVLPLNIIQSEFVEIAVYPNLQHITEMMEICKILVTPNRGYDVYWKLHETCEENECSNYQFRQENVIEQVEAIRHQSYYGGHLILNTSAMKECMIDVAIQLESKLPTKAEIHFSTNISNKSIPVVLSTKSTFSIESNEVVTLARKPGAKEVGIIRKIANMDATQIVVAEMNLEAESVIVKYEHKEEHAEILKIVFIAFYGGHQKLETLAANEIITDIFEEFLSKHVMFAEARWHQVVANVESPCKLSTQSSRFEESNEEYHFQNKRISENEIALTLCAANYEFGKFDTIESINEIESINTHWQRDERHEGVRFCICDKNFGGSLLLSTQSAQESSIIFTAALTASRSSLERVLFTILTAHHSTEQPMLATSSTTEKSAEFNCHLNHPSTYQQSEITIHTANQLKAMNVQLTESTIISETTNIQYQQPNAVVDAFSEVFPEARFGGSLILNTFAAKETSINFQSLHSPQGPKQLEVQILFIEKNRASKMYHVLATTEQIVAANVQLQKPSNFSGVEIMKRASRRGNDQYFTFTEPSEINQFNNFLWKNPAEPNAGQVAILKEMRYGGHLELSTKCATERATTITHTLMQTCAELNSTISRKTANRGESVKIFCSASQENYVTVSLELQSKKMTQFDVSTSRKASNREVPQKLNTNESSELTLTTNVTLQKSLDYESAQTLWKAKNQGGVLELQCVASSESYAELYNSLESRLSQKQHAGAMLIISEVRYGERIAINLMATEETIFNLEISLEKQGMESKQSFTSKAINVALPEILETAASEESTIEIEKMEVWRRLSEVHVESALKLDRQCLPVSLQTDSAEETFIRHESEMRVDVQRINGTTEIKKSASIMEREALTCTEALNVTLRHRTVDEEEEEKVEKRVSFAAEVTEKTMSMDMSVTVEQRETPVIVKKPMKKEQHGRRPTLRQNEAPNFIPVRRNSLLAAMELGDAHNIPHYKTLEDVIKGIKKAGLEYSNLIFGIDYTKSNKYQGERTFDGRNLHALSSDELNPYQQVIDIVGKTLSSFDADGVIPTYGFGDEESSEHGIFNLNDRNDLNAECNGFEEVLRIYTDKTPSIRMSGPTNFVPLIEQAVSIVREKHSYHILVIVADGQVTNEKINQKAIAAASRYPLSIIMVGVGDGPWNMMTRFDETLPKRMFDNFHFVDFHKVMFNAPNQEASFALNALMEIPDQYKAIKELGLLKHSRRG